MQELINQIRDVEAEIRGLQIKRELLLKLMEVENANQKQ